MTDQLLPIVPGCKALYIGEGEKKEVRCIHEIEEYAYDKGGYKATLVSCNRNDPLWLLEDEVYSGHYPNGGSIITAPFANKSDLMRIDGHKEAEKQAAEVSDE
jgi:hypothetical protein